MHKLMEYICDELEELERKSDKEGKLSMTEVQYADTLLRMKKNLLKAEEMYEESEYSEADGSYAGRSSYERSGEGSSYARGGGRGRGRNARRDSMGRYSSRRGGSSYESNRRGSSYENYSREGAREDLMMELRELEQSAGDEETKQMVKKWIRQLEQD